MADQNLLLKTMSQAHGRLGQIANHLCPKELGQRLALDAEDLATHCPVVLGAAILDIQASIPSPVILQSLCKCFVNDLLQLLPDAHTCSDYRKILTQNISLKQRLLSMSYPCDCASAVRKRTTFPGRSCVLCVWSSWPDRALHPGNSRPRQY